MHATILADSTAAPARIAVSVAVRRRVAVWLLICCALLAAMVVVGGITRLTHSGLSIVEWQPIVGAIPPLDEAAWEEAFAKYRQSPEYRGVNFGMSLAEFKRIFWWEYAHRLIGRAIGIAFALPFGYFALRRYFDRKIALQLAGIFLLGALQGAMGWYMVKSGLIDDPRVSQYRLTAHLGIAFAIYAAMFWTALGLLAPRHEPTSARGRIALIRFARAIVLLIFLQVLAGGFVAGLRAGLAYNTFPLMNGSVVPPGLIVLDPWYVNFFANVTTVQFDHRLIAWLLVIAVPWFWLRARAGELPRAARTACHALLAATALQIALGIATLLLRVPLMLAAAHQFGAMLLLTAALWACHVLRRPAAA